MNLYMHLINRQPGEFQPNYGTICYSGIACRRFASSLRQIRAEQRIAARADERDTPDRRPEYGYVRLQLGKSDEQR